MIENNRINIRPMQEGDLDSVLVIDRLSFSMPWPKSAYLHDLKKNPDALLWVAEEISQNSGIQVVGMIDVWMIIEEAHIATLAVHPDYRGRGIASGLLEVLLVEAYKRGARRAMLEVRASNKKAVSLYNQFGFKVVHRRRNYYRDNNEDALLMNLENLENQIRFFERFKSQMIFDLSSEGFSSK
jgi:ribosomal-protein-alanine N-acetyltransferase